MKKMKTVLYLMLMMASTLCTAQKSVSFQKPIRVDSKTSTSFHSQNFLSPWFDPPGSFTAEFVEDNGVFCTWGEQPPPNEAWLGYDDGVNSNSPGLGGAGTYFAAIRFEPDALAYYNEWYLSKFKFYPKKVTLDSEIKFMVWEDSNATFPVYEQMLDNLNWNEWNTIELYEAQIIDASKELWIGFEVTQPDGEDPIGHDEGPAIAGYGDMISFDGATWESLSVAYGLDFNFNLQVFVEEDLDETSDNQKSIKPNPTTFQNILQTKNFRKNQENNTDHRLEFLGINIYRNGELVNNVPVEPGIMEYLDEFFEPGTYYYTAKAVYDEGLSDPTPEVEVVIPGYPEISVSPDSLFEIHENPPQITTQTLTISNNGAEALYWEIANSDFDANKTSKPEASFPKIKKQKNKSYQSEKVENRNRNEIVPHRNTVLPDNTNDIIFNLDVETITGDNQIQGVEYDGTYLWFSGAGSAADPNYLYKVDPAGVLVATYEQPALASELGIYDLAIADGLIYGGSENHFFSFNPFSETWDTLFQSTFGAIRALAYDGYFFWTKSLGNPLYRFGQSGLVLGEFNVSVASSTSGAAFDTNTELLYLFSQDDAIFYEFDDWGNYTGITYDVSEAQAGGIAGGAFYDPGYLVPEFATLGFVLQGSPDICGAMDLYPSQIVTNDVGVNSIIKPGSAFVFTDAEPVIFRIKNYGDASQTNIPWQIVWDGPAGGDSITGVFTGVLLGGDVIEIIADTIDMTAVGDYLFEACTQLSGDENSDNDCKNKLIMGPMTYCGAFTENEDEYIANVSCGSIDNSSGWQGGVANYTGISTYIEPGGSEEITVTNGYAYASDHVTVWVDWNMDYIFDPDGDEEFVLTSDGLGEIFTGDISVPSNIPWGDYRMRVRMTYSVTPQPCDSTAYGEVEDYTIKCAPMLNTWWYVDLASGMVGPGESEDVTISFNSENLSQGLHQADILIESNDPANPEFNIPVSLEVMETEGLLIYETFEDYEANQALVQQAIAQGKTYWTTLNNQPGGTEDPMITYNAGVAAKGIVIENGNEAVMEFEDNYTEGLYNIEFSFSEEWHSNRGIFNILQKFDGENSQSGLQIIFDDIGHASINAGGENVEELQFYDWQWYRIRCTINIDNDLARLYFDDEFIIEWQWSLGAFGNGNLNQLSGIHFSGNATGTAEIYYDHIIVWKGAWPGFSPPENFQLDYDPGCYAFYFSWTYPDTAKPETIHPSMVDKHVMNAKTLVGFNFYGRDWEYGESWELLAENLQTPGYCAGWPFTDYSVEFYATTLYSWNDIFIESGRSESYEEAESIDEIEGSVKISPNPANNYLNIESKHRINRVVIFDINGLKVYSWQASANEIKINTSNFKPGVYTMQLETEKGISVHKVVVQ